MSDPLLWLPLAIAIPVFALLMFGGGDRWLADLLFRWEGGRWALQNAWLTSTVLHKGGKWLSVAASVTLLAICLAQWWRGGDRRLRWTLLYLVVCVAVATGLISVLKTLLPMDCPWDLLRYGGSRGFIGLLQQRPADWPRTACFPAGHASAGYAWLCLYFGARLWRPRWRIAGLWIGLGSGLLFGVAQQLRGAHFLSHDIATAALCWLLAVTLYLPVRCHLDGSRPPQAHA
ncbi:phosphatase PAP2 family protein [Stenotrophomonas sp. C3(2023)]|uniref:phosphatase PAP2 family protein n=1 Tax=Stenotrophomonas sp. C3(2023) TaxID=3080277 RepID=UPI00293CBE78|nr:phosphatase PAP2 family protein [Stenotrophomonas sp. C3(2023)]MDV3469313.1 phosphatase PAP2 family protein [Stenotrophomonas sp. C3(2023)]